MTKKLTTAIANRQITGKAPSLHRKVADHHAFLTHEYKNGVEQYKAAPKGTPEAKHLRSQLINIDQEKRKQEKELKKEAGPSWSWLSQGLPDIQFPEGVFSTESRFDSLTRSGYIIQ